MSVRRVSLLLVTLLAASLAQADPWLAPGDAALRSDVQLLADEGIVRTPVTAWPLSWADVVRDLNAVRGVDLRTPSLQDAYARVSREASRNTRVDQVNADVAVRLAENPTPIRTFQDTPRERGEITGALHWIGERFAARVQVTRVDEAVDGQRTRFDGSYVGVVMGNVMISAGYMEKWWGPGWDGSLILSTSARPVPSVTIERNYARAFETPVLRWLGPWRASIQAGRLERSRTDVARPHFLAARFTFKPARNLELGVTRSAQLCGRGRECNAGTYWKMLVGADNDQSASEQPGNQLAGFDFRWAPVPRLVPLAIYGQAIGEDEAGYMPSKYLGLAGVETWGGAGGWSWRARAEYARTSCGFYSRTPTLGCAYENGIYTAGYRYRGRPIGHAYDRDGSGLSVGGIARRERLTVLARAYVVNLNTAGFGAEHTLAPKGGRLRGLEIGSRFGSRFGTWGAGVSIDRLTGGEPAVKDGVRAYVEWRHAV